MGRNAGTDRTTKARITPATVEPPKNPLMSYWIVDAETSRSIGGSNSLEYAIKTARRYASGDTLYDDPPRRVRVVGQPGGRLVAEFDPKPGPGSK